MIGNYVGDETRSRNPFALPQVEYARVFLKHRSLTKVAEVWVAGPGTSNVCTGKLDGSGGFIMLMQNFLFVL